MNHADIDAFCRALPGATSDIKWQTEKVFSIGGKMFCVMAENPAQSTRISIKVAANRFLELTDQPGIRPAPYLARHGWIQLDAPDRVPSATLAAWLSDSYQLVRARLPKKFRDSLPAWPGTHQPQ
ncbi:MmcQ/YjbR family DNA-binding protein [Chitinimonas sp.]|uniref:MmcQ/YjbR family DNA-binding protein n=1 Tax=Chitinimonas sp. TaxID=1934313 RepID=UPI0035B4AEAD